MTTTSGFERYWLTRQGAGHSTREALVRDAAMLRAELLAEAFTTVGKAIKRVALAAARPLRAYVKRETTYRELVSLDDRMLADIGLTRAELFVASDAAARNDLARNDRTAANHNRPNVAA